MPELVVTQVRSSIGAKPKHRGTLRALGLGRIGKSNTLPDRPEIRGMIAKVPHMVTVDDAESSEADKAPAKRAAAKKTGTTKATAKKATAKKTTAKKAAAKTAKAATKAAAKKAPAKKAAAATAKNPETQESSQ